MEHPAQRRLRPDRGKNAGGRRHDSKEHEYNGTVGAKGVWVTGEGGSCQVQGFPYMRGNEEEARARSGIYELSTETVGCASRPQSYMEGWFELCKADQ